MTAQITNLLMLLGAAQGSLVAVLLLYSRRNRRLGNAFLALLLLFYTLPVLKVTLQELEVFQPFGFWPVELLYGLGPSIYLYAKTVTDPNFRFRSAYLWHYLPVLLEVAYYASPMFSFQHRISLPPPSATDMIWTLQQVGAVVSLASYLLLTNRRLWAYAKWVKDNYSDAHKRNLRWLQTPVWLYTGFFSLWLTLRVIDVLAFGDSLPPSVYAPLLVFLSLSTYWIGTKGYLQTHAVPAGFDSVAADPEPATAAKELPFDLVALYADLQQTMRVDRPYLQDDLSLTGLAAQIGLNPRVLSKVINSQAGMNFYDFINRYRIEEFQRRVAQPGARRTFLDLAYACGFGSKSTFNQAFKRETAMTPSQFRKRLREQAD